MSEIMLSLVPLVLVVLLSFQVFPVALGISGKESLKNTVFPIVILALSQTVLFLAGYYLGGKFMYLLRGYTSTVLFIGFFIIGIRMFMEAFKIRKGERTYELNDQRKVLLAATAQAVNTFLAGLLLYFIPLNIVTVTTLLFAVSLVMTVGGVVVDPGKQSLSFASLLYLISGILIIVSSVYFIFAAF